MEKELMEVEEILRNSKNEWRWRVAQVIAEVPHGYLATYGTISDIVNKRYGLNILGRNVGWLRGKLYELLTHDTKVPLHRIAKAGDVDSLYDSETTKSYNDRLRKVEGSLENTRWWQP